MEWYEIAQMLLNIVQKEIGQIPEKQKETFKYFIHDWLIDVEENNRRLNCGETSIEEDLENFKKLIQKFGKK
jgi:hypothetical protein